MASCSAPSSSLIQQVSTITSRTLGESCSLAQTIPGPEFEPNDQVRIPVVVHVIQNSACTEGGLSDSLVESQIEILNEDFGALAGTPGGGGFDTQIEFYLADRTPDGNPTNGITRSCNDSWYQDTGAYWETLAWNPTAYLNLYTNTAANARGYVPFLPAEGGGSSVGLLEDRVVVNWLVFGRNGAFPPHDQGRTATHEVGHYLGLFHPYFDGCGIETPPDCYTTGDRLCDTPPDAVSHDICPVGAMSCGVEVPIWNYMELTDDTCMTGFTSEQSQRMRCTLATYRTQLAESALFSDGFESGDTGAW
ncbi:MAG: zinc metalloprotease [Thermoanaerobaculia bacterium]|nr:zinc metalloprotease [Thermoanaerobaculia bacterium]